MTDDDMTRPTDRILPASIGGRPAGCDRSVDAAGRRAARAGSDAARRMRRMCASVMIVASGAAMAAGPPRLQPMQPMTLDQVMKAGAGGTGCSWSLPGDRRMRFAAAGDRAAVRLHGRIVVLSPAIRAPELFPFTFAEWRADGVTVGIADAGRARRSNTEALTVRAMLTIVIRGTVRRMEGRMSCGS